LRNLFPNIAAEAADRPSPAVFGRDVE